MNLNAENTENLKEDSTNQTTADEISLEDAEKIVGGSIDIFLTIDGIKGESGAH